MLKRVVSILITDYVLISESPFYHHRFTLYDHSASVEFTDLLEIRTFELPKLPELPDVYLWNWLRFFRAETKPGYFMGIRSEAAQAGVDTRRAP